VRVSLTVVILKNLNRQLRIFIYGAINLAIFYKTFILWCYSFRLRQLPISNIVSISKLNRFVPSQHDDDKTAAPPVSLSKYQRKR
jgi:hypothetical protein